MQNAKLQFKIQNFFKFLNQDGVSLLLVLLVLSVIFGIAFGLSTLLLVELKFSSDIAASTTAFFAADSGIERALYAIRKEACNLALCDFSESLANEASYTTTVTSAVPPIIIKSNGIFNNINRAIEVTY